MGSYNQVELISSIASASTNLATFTTEDNLQKTMPPVIIRPNTLSSGTGDASALKLRAYGQVGSTATPTFTFTIRLLTTSTWSAGGIILGTTAALTTGSGVTLAPYQIDVDIMMRTPAIGGAATVITMGTVSSQTGFPAQGTFPAAGASPALSTFDIGQQYYLFISAACSASSASNLINLQALKLYWEV